METGSAGFQRLQAMRAKDTAELLGGHVDITGGDAGETPSPIGLRSTSRISNQAAAIADHALTTGPCRPLF